MAKEVATSPYQVNLAGNARKHLDANYVADVIDDTNAKRVSLMERLAEVILDPTPELEAKYPERCTTRRGDHIIVQALIMTARHCRELSSDEASAKTAALQALCKVTIEAVKEANSASTELQRIKEHADKMRLEDRKLESKGSAKVPTLQDAIARLKKPDPKEDSE